MLELEGRMGVRGKVLSIETDERENLVIVFTPVGRSDDIDLAKKTAEGRECTLWLEFRAFQ